jgi:hypothetical protein
MGEAILRMAIATLWIGWLAFCGARRRNVPALSVRKLARMVAEDVNTTASYPLTGHVTDITNS